MRKAFGNTDIGRRRKNNQDSFLVDVGFGLFIVADGMGGYASGDVASREAVENISNMLHSRGKLLADFLREPDDEKTIRALKRLLESSVQSATYMVFGIAESSPEHHGMGTTASVLLILGKYAAIAHVGDSRIYIIREGTVRQITEDHTLVNWQVKEGIITPEEAARMPHKNVITRAVGNRDYVQVDTLLMPIEDSDQFLLCSDGLHGYLGNEEIADIVSLGLEDGVQRFIDLANQRGGKDNITAILVGPVD